MTNSYKILVVDDEELNVELLIDVLEDEGYQVATASNGEEAITQFRDFKPDMVLLDVMMPVMDGYQACLGIRDLEDDIGKDVPILFISAKASLEDKVHGYEVGGNDYITKPFDNSELLIKIELTFKEKKQINNLQESVDSSNAMAYSLMTTASKVGAIGQFLRDALSCSTLDKLFQSFCELSLSAKLGCTIKTTFNNEIIIVSDDGVEHAIDFEIVRNYSSDERIFYFGKNRALFNWGNVILLVRNVGDEADNIAIMLDGLSASVQFIQMQTMLINSIHAYKEESKKLGIKSANAVGDLEDEMRQAFSEMGAGSGLNETEEELVHSIIGKNRDMLDEIFLSGRQLEKEMDQALNQYLRRE